MRVDTVLGYKGARHSDNVLYGRVYGLMASNTAMDTYGRRGVLIIQSSPCK
jgi:hypothetical protein